ncbi:MAG: hypothetical protein HQK91_08405 [Nitrospirae bacterium]|nr:hypothetical protein [Nitrospirota bacterium]MBF0541454.1 hypothetical protein [Nitrospirota bacterium]
MKQTEFAQVQIVIEDATQNIMDIPDELAPAFRELMAKERHLNIITNILIGGIKKC